MGRRKKTDPLSSQLFADDQRDLFEKSYEENLQAEKNKPVECLESDDRKVVRCFEHYLEHEGGSISRAEFEKNMIAKLKDPAFLDDINPLLPAGVEYSTNIAGALIQDRLVSRLRGEPWKGRAKKNAKRG